MRTRIVEGDLLAQDVDVIVNAANTHLAHMGGIAGIISRAAGPQLQAESTRARPIATGNAVATTAGKLPFRAVIHAVGPIWNGGEFQEGRLLCAAHMSAIRVAAEIGAKSVAFPAVSCGIFGYPVEQAAPIALAAVRDACGIFGGIEEVRFCLMDPLHLAAFIEALP